MKKIQIDISLAQYLDETTLKRYPTDEYMQDGDVVINSTGTGTLGRVGIYRDGDNTTGLSVVPDSHVTIIRGFSCICPYYLYAYIKAHQSELEKKGEGSTNQKELKPLTLKEMLSLLDKFFFFDTDTLKKNGSRFIIWVLGYKLTMYGEV